jgi:hypothetical protein
LNIRVAEQHLNGAEIGAGFEQVRRAAVPEDMRADVLVNPGAPRRAALLIAWRMLFGSSCWSGRIAEGKSQSFGLSRRQ